MNLNRVLQVESVTKFYGKGDNKTEALRGKFFGLIENKYKQRFLGNVLSYK